MVIDVAAGVLINANDEVLLAQRPEGKHMAGYWEFPGGKFEPGETAEDALKRELKEELGIDIAGSAPVIELVHHYPERSVRLHVRVVREWAGELQSLDQQALEWVGKASMTDWRLLPADGPIVQAVCLPDLYAVSPEVIEGASWAELLPKLERLKSAGVSLLQWRQSAFGSAAGPSRAAIALAEQVANWAEANSVIALLNCRMPLSGDCWAQQLGFSGVHLSEHNQVEHRQVKYVQAGQAKARCDALGLRYLAASCHDAESLRQAEKIKADFAVLGAVRPTASHVGATPLGWSAFAALVNNVAMPVFAIGGCEVSDVVNAKNSGGQGVAAIRALWPVVSAQ